MDEIWIRNTFDWCVNILFNIADNIGISYEALNVWVFLILIPVFLEFLLAQISIFYGNQASLKENLLRRIEN